MKKKDQINKVASDRRGVRQKKKSVEKCETARRGFG